MADDFELTLYGGGTLIFDEYGRLKYQIRRRVFGRYQTEKLQELYNNGYFSDDHGLRKVSFAALHAQRAGGRANLFHGGLLAMAVKPKKVTLRTYQVGFGDCFLMIVGYSDGSEKFVLFDFGTTALPKSLGKTQGQWLKMIADDIKQPLLVAARYRGRDTSSRGPHTRFLDR